MTPALVTVVVPVYNGAAYLRPALDSIVGQRYRPLEIIVLDDASTDETPSIAGSFGDRVRVIRQARNLGQFANVNAGIALARGEFVAVFHADDLYDADILEREVAFLSEHPKVTAVFCLDKFIDAAGREYGRLALPPELCDTTVLDYPRLLEVLLRRKNRVLRAPGALVRREVYHAVGVFDPHYRIASDLEMWLRIARHGPIGLLHEHLFSYRHFHGNLSHHYRHLRTSPDVFFELMDDELAAWGRTRVSAGALAAYEAHRAEELLMNAVSQYIAGDVASARRTLDKVRVTTLWQTDAVQRARLTILLVGLRGLGHLPRVALVADAFARRWYPNAPPAA
jgi:GT2 family glycosyltransferase